MKRLLLLIQKNINKKRKYLYDARHEIAERNLGQLRALCLISVLLLLFFILLTPLIIKDWQIGWQHLLFCPALLMLYIVAVLYDENGQCSNKIITSLCLVFESLVFSFVILIDIVGNNNVPVTFMPLLYISLPIMFILPFSLSYPLLFLFEGIYIAAIYFYKDPAVAQYDIFNSIAAILFSFIVAFATTRLRMSDYNIRIKYKKLSDYDLLSNIFNKNAFERYAKKYLKSDSDSTPCALLIIDIDNFKIINDSAGHYIGDMILSQIGNSLPKIFEKGDIVGRFGGDEFVVLIKKNILQAEIESLCNKLQSQIMSIDVLDSSYSITCSIGCAISDGSINDFDQLFRQADKALYKSKNNGKNTYSIINCAQKNSALL